MEINPSFPVRLGPQAIELLLDSACERHIEESIEMRITPVKAIPLLLYILIAASLLSGCGSSESAQSDQSNESVNAAQSDWTCDSRQDGLGETTGCTSTVEDGDGVYWTLMLMCTSDLRTLHSVTGFYPSGSSVYWPIQNTAKIRIDSGPLQDVRVTTKASGQGLVLLESLNASEDASTWDLMSKIASAKTFGFKAADADGYSRSALFKVAGSVPIAAKFSVMGCKSS